MSSRKETRERWTRFEGPTRRVAEVGQFGRGRGRGGREERGRGREAWRRNDTPAVLCPGGSKHGPCSASSIIVSERRPLDLFFFFLLINLQGVRPVQNTPAGRWVVGAVGFSPLSLYQCLPTRVSGCAGCWAAPDAANQRAPPPVAMPK